MEIASERGYFGPGAAAHVDADTQCGVMLMDDANVAAYRAGRPYKCFGGIATHFPAVVTPPHPGHWTVVLDLPNRGPLNHSIRIVAP